MTRLLITDVYKEGGAVYIKGKRGVMPGITWKIKDADIIYDTAVRYLPQKSTVQG
jgi:hypothetical protein